MSDPFLQIEQICEQQGIEAALQFLVQHFRESGDHHHLFEALKMMTRHNLGLPLLYGDQPDRLDEQQQRQLEDGILAACREVGTRFVQEGNLREGWLYLQPLGDRNLNAELISSVPVNPDTVDDLIEIGLMQAAAPELGYSILLEQHGTCNAITTFDSFIVQLDKPLQRKLAAILVKHVYSELVANVSRHIEEQENESKPLSKSLAELVLHRAWLTADGAHHIDTTHLASLMRIGRLVTDPESLQMLLELARYGEQLDSDFHYPGHPPFEDTYRDHIIFYRALCGEDVAAAIEHFQSKLAATDQEGSGIAVAETLVDLLHRTGHPQQALKLAVEQLLGNEQTLGIAPNVFAIAQEKSDYRILMDHYRQQSDLLGYSVGLLQARGRHGEG